MSKPVSIQIVRGICAIAWLATLAATARAVPSYGLTGVGDIFFGDFGHPWRAQFNTDFGFHLILMAAWISWRESKPHKRVGFGLAGIFLGGLFSFAYIFAATFRSNDSISQLLTGQRLPVSNQGPQS